MVCGQEDDFNSIVYSKHNLFEASTVAVQLSGWFDEDLKGKVYYAKSERSAILLAKKEVLTLITPEYQQELSKNKTKYAGLGEWVPVRGCVYYSLAWETSLIYNDIAASSIVRKIV